ncbi:bifunctional diaminohydroxyphosphoribosylaminopyrimidine deaminase/5-amino-6-(5-phosphoribosylamino)uracil reductase RibD [Campylobacter suis]|uniref:CMP/dCMP-type deaminase domain-containing protein n=1 Tax=Campylobacter suis TaxID=2790657 RepID=A0ABN7K1J7_9BACT|nr:bifunctional diaminohydroxyphosphoribosylaminopyrimidine deaminase/5-amino-6-(5-phosphoribosylamino)uracil reductase RibD [Campylobacter suis]CAD7286413.1 hypothetical protein LMG8286_00244 [Campylobacter suis]
MTDDFYMQLAINEAWKHQLLTYPNPAVGCVVLDKNGKILSISSHKKAGFMHAEPSAILQALCTISSEFASSFLREYQMSFELKSQNITQTLENENLDAKFCYDFILKNHSNLLKGASAYVTLEPCSHHGKTPPCASLIANLGFKRVVIANYDENEIASGGVKILKEAGVEVVCGVLSKLGSELLEPFMAWQSGNFSFFKIALSANGVATGGVISNQASRTHMHALRSVCDMLVISGNTVRIDRPTLDTRLTKDGKSPDILIYSRSKNFDKSIPLFGVKDRSVSISDSLKSAFDRGLVMFEGAQGLLNALPNEVKWVLVYQSSTLKNAQNLISERTFEPLHSVKFDDDTATWYRIR